MIGLVRFLYLLAVGLWIGEIAAFSFLVAPAVFRVLDSAAAGDVVGAIFPRYYLLGAVAGATACGLGLVLANASGHPRWWLAVVGPFVTDPCSASVSPRRSGPAWSCSRGRGACGSPCRRLARNRRRPPSSAVSTAARSR